MVDPTLPLPGLSPIEGKEIVARFDGGRLSSDGGLASKKVVEICGERRAGATGDGSGAGAPGDEMAIGAVG
jgi:hypothetical protein